MQSFLGAYSYTGIGLLNNLSAQEAIELTMDVQQTQNWEANQYAIYDLLNQMADIDALLVAGGSAAQIEQWWADRLILHAALVQAEALALQLESQFLSTRTQKIAQLAAQNAAISTNSSYDGNEKTLHEIWLSTLAQDLPVSASQQNTIQSIAEQCTTLGGPSVYWARAWYSYLTGDHIAGSEQCLGARGKKDAIVGASVSVTPNPSNDLLLIQKLEGAFGANALITLYNQVGNIVLQTNPAENTERFTVDISTLASGIYFMVLSETGMVFNASKVVVARP
jgi:hypothetical protein